MRRDYKIKFTDKSKANLWIYLDLAKVHRLKGLTSPYIISYLHFLNLNNILALSQTLVIAQDGFGLMIWMMFALFVACQIYVHAYMVVYKIKTNASRPCSMFKDIISSLLFLDHLNILKIRCCFLWWCVVWCVDFDL